MEKMPTELATMARTALSHIKVQLDNAWREDMIGKEVVGGVEQSAKKESTATTDPRAALAPLGGRVWRARAARWAPGPPAAAAPRAHGGAR